MTDNDAAPKGIDLPAVSAWLDANIDGVEGPYDVSFITGGHSNLTYRVSPATGGDLVLRRPPLGAVLESAHDMAREHRIIAGVGKTSVPVPAALGLCEDVDVNGAPFYVMNHVDGTVLHNLETSLEEMGDEGARRDLSVDVANVLADLHTADVDGIGLGELGRKEAYLDRQLRRWSRQWEAAKTRELSDMEDAYALLVEAKPEQRYTGIVHGDYRLGNMLIDPTAGTVQAVLDWELCTLGDVLADLGYLLNNWAEDGESVVRGATAYPTMAPGWMTRDELVGAYVERTGFEVEGIAYYQAFQFWRLAAIVEGVLARYLAGVMGDGGDTDLFREQVDSLAAEALRLVRTLG